MYADIATDRAFARRCMLNLGVDPADAEIALQGRYDNPVALMSEVLTVSSVLKELPIDRIRLLKIDVEQSELDVLIGVDDTDWPRIDQVVIEVHDMDSRLETINRLLTRHGFEIKSEQEAAMRGTCLHLVYATKPKIQSAQFLRTTAER